jgi:hypothetical protein
MKTYVLYIYDIPLNSSLNEKCVNVVEKIKTQSTFYNIFFSKTVPFLR